MGREEESRPAVACICPGCDTSCRALEEERLLQYRCFLSGTEWDVTGSFAQGIPGFTALWELHYSELIWNNDRNRTYIVTAYGISKLHCIIPLQLPEKSPVCSASTEQSWCEILFMQSTRRACKLQKSNSECICILSAVLNNWMKDKC